MKNKRKQYDRKMLEINTVTDRWESEAQSDVKSWGRET